VGGVGYELEVPMSTFYELPDIGQSSVLLVHMLVREDAAGQDQRHRDNSGFNRSDH